MESRRLSQLLWTLVIAFTLLLTSCGGDDDSGNGGPPSPPPPPVLSQCSDGIDNDGDGLVDLADPGCADASDDDESDDPNSPQCSDGIDNDGDGLVDLADPGCADASDDDESDDPNSPQCSDGIDNDGDGLVDLADPGCADTSDDDESDDPGSPGTITGLDFPGSAAVSSTMRFKFTGPMPIYGNPGGGVTYIWRAYPRQQAGYYTAFFWGNDDGQGNLNTFLWDNGAADSYYGAHPYPNPPPNGTAHNWEVSVEQNDYVNGAVEYNRWHLQALRVWEASDGKKHHEFYWDLPNTDSAHRVTRISPANWGNKNPPAPVLTWGDAPWQPGNEVWNGILRGIQIYDGLLSVPDIVAETNSPLSTAAGSANIWYLNLNPTPSDISDKSGSGNNPVWVGNERPSLYEE